MKRAIALHRAQRARSVPDGKPSTASTGSGGLVQHWGGTPIPPPCVLVTLMISADFLYCVDFGDSQFDAIYFGSTHLVTGHG